MLLCATSYTQNLCTYEFLRGSNTWVDAVEIAYARKRMKWLNWVLND